MEKSTKMFENRIDAAKNVEDLKEILADLPKETFRNRLTELCVKYDMSYSKLQTESGINKSSFYAFFEKEGSKQARKPQKHHIIKIGLALGATVEEINELLKLAKHKELYAKNRDDMIVIFGIKNNLKVEEIEELLIDSGSSLSLIER